MNQIVIALASFLLAMFVYQVNIFSVYGEDMEITSGSSFVDSSGKLNIIGVVTNLGTNSEHVTVGLDVHNRIDGSRLTLHDTTFSKIIYPGKESPFKFKISDNFDVLSKPYLLQMENGNEPYYNIIVQNYSNFPTGKNRELVGTLKNTGNVVVQNISVYASVHDENGMQIDSIQSNTIPILKPGQVKRFSARPDDAIVKNVNYFSCAGFDPNSPINTLDLGNGKFLAYGLESVAKISKLSYDKSNDSISFTADHYSPLGGSVTFKIPQLDINHNITIYVDNLSVKDQQVTKSGKTITTNIFVPPNEHTIKITGILNQT